MIRILAKIFIKGTIDGPQEAGEPETKGDGDAGSAHQDRAAVRRAYGMLCSLVGIGLNILLFAGKYLAGRLSGSIAVTAAARGPPLGESASNGRVRRGVGVRLVRSGRQRRPPHPCPG